MRATCEWRDGGWEWKLSPLSYLLMPSFQRGAS